MADLNIQSMLDLTRRAQQPTSGPPVLGEGAIIPTGPAWKRRADEMRDAEDGFNFMSAFDLGNQTVTNILMRMVGLAGTDVGKRARELTKGRPWYGKTGPLGEDLIYAAMGEGTPENRFLRKTAGIALDIFLDPLTYVGAGLAGKSVKLAKAGQYGKKAAKLAKVGRFATAAQKAAQAKAGLRAPLTLLGRVPRAKWYREAAEQFYIRGATVWSKALGATKAVTPMGKAVQSFVSPVVETVSKSLGVAATKYPRMNELIRKYTGFDPMGFAVAEGRRWGRATEAVKAARGITDDVWEAGMKYDFLDVIENRAQRVAGQPELTELGFKLRSRNKAILWLEKAPEIGTRELGDMVALQNGVSVNPMTLQQHKRIEALFGEGMEGMPTYLKRGNRDHIKNKFGIGSMSDLTHTDAEGLIDYLQGTSSAFKYSGGVDEWLNTGYMAHLARKEHQEALLKILPSDPKISKQWSTHHASQLGRTLQEKGLHTIREVNEYFLKEHGIQDLLHTDVGAIMAQRYLRTRTSVQNARLMREIGKGWGMTPDTAKAKGVRAIGLGREGMEHLVFEPEVAREVNRVAKLYTSPEELYKLEEFVNNLTGIFKSQAVMSPGFHTRNFFSNIVFGWLGGNKDPRTWARSMKLLWSHSAPESLKVGRFTGRQILDEAVRYGVLENGFYAGMMTPDVMKVVYGDALPSPLKMVKKSFDELSGDLAKAMGNPEKAAALTRWFGRQFTPKGAAQQFNFAMGTKGVEGPARLALFIDRIEKGDDFAQAAMHTKKFLLDYSPRSFSPFERRVLRNVLPFYGFARRNLPLQLEMLITAPGKQATFMKGLRYVNEWSNIHSQDERWMADWMKERMPIRLPGTKGKMYLMLENYIPQAEINRMLKPVQTFGEMLTPWVKTAFEIMMNQSIYFGKEIAPPGAEKGEFTPLSHLGVPDIDKRLIYIFRSITPLRLLANMMPYKYEEGKNAPLMLRTVGMLVGKVYSYDEATARSFMLRHYDQTLGRIKANLRRKGWVMAEISDPAKREKYRTDVYMKTFRDYQEYSRKRYKLAATPPSRRYLQIQQERAEKKAREKKGADPRASALSTRP